MDGMESPLEKEFAKAYAALGLDRERVSERFAAFKEQYGLKTTPSSEEMGRFALRVSFLSHEDILRILSANPLSLGSLTRSMNGIFPVRLVNAIKQAEERYEQQGLSSWVAKDITALTRSDVELMRQSRNIGEVSITAAFLFKHILEVSPTLNKELEKLREGSSPLSDRVVLALEKAGLLPTFSKAGRELIASTVQLCHERPEAISFIRSHLEERLER